MDPHQNIVVSDPDLDQFEARIRIKFRLGSRFARKSTAGVDPDPGVFGQIRIQNLKAMIQTRV